jgi:sulfur carrier protein
VKISVNGDLREVANTNLASALTELGFADAKVASAVNGEFVPAALRASTELGEGDSIEVLAPMQGG